MSRLTQRELLNNACKEAVYREEQRKERYKYLFKNIKDERLKSLFGEFARTCHKRLEQLTAEMRNFNIKKY